jgi:hypothetical protein
MRGWGDGVMKKIGLKKSLEFFSIGIKRIEVN